MQTLQIFDDSVSHRDIAETVVDEWKSSQVIEDMKSADKYYAVENEQILGKSRVYYDSKGTSHDNKAAYNAQITSGFLRTLVQQKQDYGFAKTFILKIVADGKEVTDDDYLQKWKDFCSKDLYKIAYNLAGQAVNKGIAWAYVWIDENSELNIVDVSPETVYPVWKDKNHTELNQLIHNYTQTMYTDEGAEQTEYAEYWDSISRELYNVTDSYAPEPIKDASGKTLTTHMSSGSGGVNWDKVPFIALKGTKDEKPLLNLIKHGIDAYDALNSKSIDGLVDDLDPLLVMKGISAEVGGLIEARELAKLTRMIVIDEGGEAFYLQAKTEVAGNLTMMENLRKDIIRFGYGIDFEDARFGGNPNQLVIKSLYQNLDTYIDGVERNFQDFIDTLKYFFDKYLELTNQGNFEALQQYNIVVKLDRAMMINQSALIEDTVKLQGTGISQETLLEFNPIVQDVELEKERLENEAKKMETSFDFAEPQLSDNLIG